VKDEYPENRKLHKWKIPAHKVIRFPSDKEEEYKEKEKVLALWYIDETEEWSSMFYNAVVVHNVKKGDEKVSLRFEGDDEVYPVDVTKLVKKPKRSDKTRRPRKRKRKNSESEIDTHSQTNGELPSVNSSTTSVDTTSAPASSNGTSSNTNTNASSSHKNKKKRN